MGRRKSPQNACLGIEKTSRRRKKNCPKKTSKPFKDARWNFGDIMVEIKFQGRGGQGVVIAAQMLARVYFSMGRYPQCFALFGGERRGAPVASFLRVDDTKIYLKCEIKRPDRLIFFAADLVDESDVNLTSNDGRFLLINTTLPEDHYESLKKFPLVLVDATAIAARQGIGTAINAAMIGAYCRAAGDISRSTLENAVRMSVPAKVEENVRAAREAYEMTQLLPEKRQ